MKTKGIIEGAIDTNCRTETGITVGLIDGMIAQIRILRKRELTAKEIKEVFADLADDEDFKWLYDKAQEHKS